jgi:DNA repair exonuclease SbcCD ATPase subunit
LNSEANNLGNSIVERDSMLNDLFSSLNEIENTLNTIKDKREQLQIVGKEGSVGMKESILSDIKMLDALLDKSTQKVSELNKKLRDSGVQIASLNKRLALLTEELNQQTAQTEQLKQELSVRETRIASLNGKVDQLSSEVEKRDKSIAQKSDVISKQDRELNKGYLAYGTYKQLKSDGILEREGGFLGLGRNKSIKGKVNPDKFMKLDIRETREIPLYSKKIKLITEHPDSSYSLKVENGLVTYLEIENPEEFWKLSKYAVIETR